MGSGRLRTAPLDFAADRLLDAGVDGFEARRFGPTSVLTTCVAMAHGAQSRLTSARHSPSAKAPFEFACIGSPRSRWSMTIQACVQFLTSRLCTRLSATLLVNREQVTLSTGTHFSASTTTVKSDYCANVRTARHRWDAKSRCEVPQHRPSGSRQTGVHTGV